ncbi:MULTISPECIES: LysR family transcriptional regulator [Enterococcus]|uniref:LysR family transcriptional regulator n=1 Tax=Candidatus Enterococcus murrayae TaxID=2815321 RepID=A0ABS3HQ03_9ENTE|nr:LysR family transcriptional regulator [Enterococcus sp. MJM16]MBO0454683.1 LysR family transcriptional regulator [Enterococcus sp. MJM16]
MNFKQCVIFREIARTKNFTRAANNLYLTQSAVSHAVKDLEDEAGTQLFERLHRGVEMTPAGELFLREIQPLIEGFESVEAHLPNLEKQPPLKIASCITYAQTELPQLLRRFTEKYPAASFNVQVFPASDSIARLERGEVDLAFIEGHILQPAFESKKIADYRLCVVAAADAKESQLSFEELIQRPLLLRERGSAVREAFESVAVLQGFKLFPAWESIDSQALISALKAGFGLSVLPYRLVKEELLQGSLKEIKIDDWQLTNDITVLVRKSRYQPRMLADFWKMLHPIE